MSSPLRPPPRDVAHVQALVRWLLITVFVVLGYLVLRYLAGVLAPILTALGIAYLLNPVLERIERLGASRAVGAGLLLVTFVALFGVGLVVVLPAVARQLEQFVVDLPRYVDNLTAWARAHLGLEVPTDWKRYVESDHLRSTLGTASGPLRDLATAALGGAFSVLAVLAELLLIPVFAFYFLTDWPHLLRRFDHVVPPRRRAEVREVARDIDRVVAGWVRGQAIVTTILAFLYAIAFSLIGMPLSLPIGLLVGALTVIPFVGTFVGATIALLVTLASGGGLEMVGMVGAVILALHLLEAAVLTPKIVGHRVGLSESGALLAVVAGGKLLGFVGVVLAVPIAATVAVLVRYAVRFYEHTAFFGHESDADVVITPAMAIIMPGIVAGARIVADAQTPGTAAALDAGPEAGTVGPAGVPTLAPTLVPTLVPTLDRTVDESSMVAPDLLLGPSGAPTAERPPAADSAAEPEPPSPSPEDHA